MQLDFAWDRFVAKFAQVGGRGVGQSRTDVQRKDRGLGDQILRVAQFAAADGRGQLPFTRRAPLVPIEQLAPAPPAEERNVASGWIKKERAIIGARRRRNAREGP